MGYRINAQTAGRGSTGVVVGSGNLYWCMTRKFGTVKPDMCRQIDQLVY